MLSNFNSIIKIGITDDHPAYVSGITDIINGFEEFKVVLQAGNSHELFRKLEVAEEIPDILLLDISMPPGKNGYEVAKELRRTWPQVKILAMSMYNSEEAIIRMLGNGAKGFLRKNVKPKEIADALRSMANKGYYDSDLVSEDMFERAKKCPPEDLNPREMEYLTLCCQAYTDKEIAAKMNIALNTVHWHRQDLCEKLKVTNKTGLMFYAMRTGLFPFTDF